MVHIYNTLYGAKEALPRTRQKLKMFVCGPTVYDFIHIGNARTYVAFDIIVRWMRAEGYRVEYLQNITDIDDKILDRAERDGVPWKAVSRRYEKAYYDILKKLNVGSVSIYARATDHIPEIVKQVQTLLKKGKAYLIPDDGYYFDLSTYPDYGRLAHRTLEQAEDGVSRVDSSDLKRNRGDFCLWKLSKPGERFWQTPLGNGRPGWHIEDTAITERFFGPQYDIHGGGIDLLFPHHEAERAQQESASDLKPFVKIWVHAGLLNLNGRKMSKSLGNFITAPEMLAAHSGDVFRMMVLSSHYRSVMNYTKEVALQAEKNLEELRMFLAKLDLVISSGRGNSTFALRPHEEKFKAAMNDDLNTPQALAVLFGLMNEAHKDLWMLSKKEARSLRKWLGGILATLGFELEAPKIAAAARKAAAKREVLRSNKQFIQADALRKQAEGLGYTIEDTPLGPFVWPAKKND